MSLVPVYAALAGTALGGGISAGMSLYMFKQQAKNWISQQWWERKAETYSKIVEELWHLAEYAREGEAEAAAQRGEGRGPKYGIEHNFPEHRSDLKRIADIGPFVITREAAEAISSYMRETDPDTVNVYDMEVAKVAQIHREAAEKCLVVVRTEATKDLRVGVR